MFYYYGRKGRIAKSYPAPIHPIVIEPFAGSMGYTLHHRPDYAIGIEADEQTAGLWHRLARMTREEIEALPLPIEGERCYDRYWLMALASNSSLQTSYRTLNGFSMGRFANQRNVTLKHHSYARERVLYLHGSYDQAPDIEATWFIDPPYVLRPQARQRYRKHDIDYDALAQWCLSRRGQVIVCEGIGTWLPFKYHSSMRTMVDQSKERRDSTEVIFKHATSMRCERCDTPFPIQHPKARYCSGACRTAAYRERLASGPGRGQGLEDRVRLIRRYAPE
jgi:hypothetical protein